MLWLQWRPFSARVEVLRRKQGAYSGIKAVCILICIGRDAPFGAKPRPACRAKGYETSLMNLSEGKELFIGNRQNGERPYRKTFPYPQKMQAFFAFRSGLHHSRKFDAAGLLLCLPEESTVHPALLRVTSSRDQVGVWLLPYA